MRPESKIGMGIGIKNLREREIKEELVATNMEREKDGCDGSER